MVRKFTTVGLTLLPLLGMLTGCPKKEPVVVDAGAPAPVATPAATVEDLKPMDTEDAGPDTGVDAGKKPGVAGNRAIARLPGAAAVRRGSKAGLFVRPEDIRLFDHESGRSLERSSSRCDGAGSDGGRLP